MSIRVSTDRGGSRLEERVYTVEEVDALIRRTTRLNARADGQAGGDFLPLSGGTLTGPLYSESFAKFDGNITAFANGSGALSGTGVYDVTQLNVSGNIALSGDDLLDNIPSASNEGRINAKWISGESGTIGFVEDIKGTANRITVSSTNNVYTLTTPQDLHTGANFAVATLNATGNITAYVGGSGAAQGGGVYDVSQLNLGTGNLSIDGEDVFGTVRNTARQIDSSWISGSTGSSGVTEWGPTGNKRTGSVSPQGGDYSFSQIGGSVQTGQLPSTVMLEGENISLLNNNAGYITGSDVPTYETDPNVPTHVKNITNAQIGEWDDAYARSPVDLTGSGNGVVTLHRQNNLDLDINLNHTHSQYVVIGSDARLNTLYLSANSPWITLKAEDTALRFYHDTDNNTNATTPAYQWYSGQAEGATSSWRMELDHQGKLTVIHDVEARDFVV